MVIFISSHDLISIWSSVIDVNASMNADAKRALVSSGMLRSIAARRIVCPLPSSVGARVLGDVYHEINLMVVEQFECLRLHVGLTGPVDLYGGYAVVVDEGVCASCGVDLVAPCC